MWGAESIPTNKKIERVEDFQGVKMRSPEGIAAQMWRAIGVGVSTLPGSEVYTALDTGKIDATDWGSLGMNDQLGFGKIAKYAIYPGIHSMPAGDVAVNQKTWDALPDDIKQAIETAVRNLNTNMLAANQALDDEAAAKRDPASLLAWSAEERVKLRNVAKGNWAEWAKKSPMAEKLYQSHVAYMQSIGLLSN
jgi:TRAP-type mannitol/chloroaromatic compound transport system substrate-binding protein